MNKPETLETELFDAIVKLCTMIRSDENENPVWGDIESAMQNFRVKYPDYKADIDYDRVVKWRALSATNNI